MVTSISIYPTIDIDWSPLWRIYVSSKVSPHIFDYTIDIIPDTNNGTKIMGVNIDDKKGKDHIHMYDWVVTSIYLSLGDNELVIDNINTCNPEVRKILSDRSTIIDAIEDSPRNIIGCIICDIEDILLPEIEDDSEYAIFMFIPLVG